MRARNSSGDDAFLRLKGNDTFQVDAFDYYHIQNLQYGLNDWVFEKGVQIAEVRDYPDANQNYGTEEGDHLHFNDWTKYGDPVQGGVYYATNPVRSGGLSYTQDSSIPLLKGDYLRIQPEGSNQESPQPLGGQVDFIVAAKDISAIDGRIGLAEIRYTIGGLSYQVVILDQDIVFNNEVIPYLYCKHCGGGLPYSPDEYVYYYITNNITDPSGNFQDYFDTNLLLDGNFQLCVTVEDYAGYTDQECFNITIDNSATMKELVK